MSSTNTPEPGQIQDLQRRFNEVGIPHILQVDSPFTSDDLDLPEGISPGVLNWLHQKGAVHKRETRKPCGSGGSYYIVWEWDETVKERLEAYEERRDRFSDYVADGCECNPHIYNPSDSDGFECRYCGQSYTREEMQQVDV
jgi:hypothetical protein